MPAVNGETALPPGIGSVRIKEKEGSDDYLTIDTAEGLVGLKMNLEQKNLESLMKLLPALKRPTIAPLSEAGWVAIEVVIEEKLVKRLIPQLKRGGAEGIIEYPLNKVIP